MKLIMETWRKFENTAKDKETHVFLFENNEPVKTNFNVLLEQYDSKQITEDQLVKLWEDSFNYEYEQILKEVDWEKEAELTADPDYKPPQERGGAVEKINDMLLKAAIQAQSMIQKSVVLAFKAISFVVKLIGRFKDRYPVLAKIALVSITAVALTVLMAAVSTPEAQAAIRSGGEILTEKEVNWIRGSFSDILRVSKPMQKELGYDAMFVEAQFNEIMMLAHESKEVIDIETIQERLPKALQKAGKMARVLTKTILETADDTRELIKKAEALKAAGDREAANKIYDSVEGTVEMFKGWRKYAENLQIRVDGVEMPTPEMFRKK